MVRDRAQATGGFDPRLAALVRWETRVLLGTRAQAWAIVMGALAVVVSVFAYEAAQTPGAARWLGWWPAAAWIGISPPDDTTPSPARITLGYSLLYFALAQLLAVARLVLPLLASGTISRDRRTGRLEELRTTPITVWSLFAAKVIAAATPFAATLAGLALLLLGTALTQGAPLTELAVLVCGAVADLAAMAALVVMCGALWPGPWSGRISACLAVWFAAPAVWCGILWLLGARQAWPAAPWWNLSDFTWREPWEWPDLWVVRAAQLAASALAVAAAVWVGGAALHARGMRAGLGSIFRRRGRRPDAPPASTTP